jgi:hypothetical protein
MEQQREVAMQFPRLRERAQLVDDSDYFSAPEKSFEFGLEAIFDGLERQLKQRQLKEGQLAGRAEPMGRARDS